MTSHQLKALHFERVVRLKTAIRKLNKRAKELGKVLDWGVVADLAHAEAVINELEENLAERVREAGKSA